MFNLMFIVRFYNDMSLFAVLSICIVLLVISIEKLQTAIRLDKINKLD